MNSKEGGYMRYFGSKTTTLDFIKRIADELHFRGCICDPFGGIGTVGAFLKANQYSIVSGDVLTFAHCFQIARIGINNKTDIPNLQSLQEIKKFFNSIRECDGWFVQYYSKDRSFFTISNAQKIQACINTIWAWHQSNHITQKEFCLLIASLINSMDKVANTAGTYYAYLKEFNRKAVKPFKFELLEPILTETNGEAFLIDALQLINRVKCDILYLDPPYNSRDYSQYYYLPEIIAKKIIPEPHGLSGIHHLNYEKSKFTQKAIAGHAFREIINKTKCENIIFHYSDSGLISKDLILDILNRKGEVFDIYCNSKGYSTGKEKKNILHHIYGVRCK